MQDKTENNSKLVEFNLEFVWDKCKFMYIQDGMSLPLDRCRGVGQQQKTVHRRQLQKLSDGNKKTVIL